MATLFSHLSSKKPIIESVQAVSPHKNSARPVAFKRVESLLGTCLCVIKLSPSGSDSMTRFFFALYQTRGFRRCQSIFVHFSRLNFYTALQCGSGPQLVFVALLSCHML
jgi:hypothetical protein